MTRATVAKCLCGCDQFVVIDQVRHEAIGTCPDSWDAARVASAINGHRCPPSGEAITCDGCEMPVVVMPAVAAA